MTDRIYKDHLRAEKRAQIIVGVILVLLVLFFIPKIIREWKRGEYYMLILFIFIALATLIPVRYHYGIKKKWKLLLQDLGAESNSALDELLKNYSLLDEKHFISDAFYVNLKCLYVCPVRNIRTVRLLKDGTGSDEFGERFYIPFRVEIEHLIPKGRYEVSKHGVDIIFCESKDDQQRIFQILRSAAPPDCKFREGWIRKIK